MYRCTALNAIYCFLRHCSRCIICGCHQGGRRPEACDLSRGLEKVPILVDETCTPSAVSPLDTPYVYAISPILHESVTLEAVASACSIRMFSLCTSESNCSDTGGVHSSWEDSTRIAYDNDRAISAGYITEVSESTLFCVCVTLLFCP